MSLPRLATSPLALPHAWDLVATDYTRDFSPHCADYAVDALELAPLAHGARVLDVAAGPGTLSLLAAKQGLSVTALDFSRDMIAQLEARAAHAGLSHRIDARTGDGQALPRGMADFDAVFSIFGLIFFADRARGLSEMYRVLAPGGRVIITSWAPFEAVPALRMLFAALRHAAPELGIPPAPAPLGSVDEMREALLSAGFEDVRVHTRAHDLQFSSVSELWSVFARSAAPIALVRERVGEKRWLEISSEAVAELEALSVKGPLAVLMPAYLGVGIRPA